MMATNRAHTGFRVELLDAAALNGTLGAEVGSLATRALEPNVFFEPWQLAPALELFAPPQCLLLTIRHPGGELRGFFPTLLQRRFRGLPIKTLQLWRHEYCFLGSPLIDSTDAEQTLAALLDWLASGAAPAHLMEWTRLRIDGPCWPLLNDLLCARAQSAVDVVSHERALLVPSRQTHSGLSGKHRKELRRQERRLRERGQLGYRELQPREDVHPWLNDFLRLEKSGWKGRAETALATDASSLEYFRRVVLSGAPRGQVNMLAIELDGKPIAMKCNFITGSSAFAFKIAYDEDYARYSPGVLLEQYTMQSIGAGGRNIDWMDSCAKAHHPMIERLWNERRMIADHVIVGCGMLASALVGSMPVLRSVRRRLRQTSADEERNHAEP
jgi:CelD/BcsL family acetyltransferase involved in cellulose biosynthesis